jgi:holo-ACP synthase / triphosphoribosyl-dephospho-CoA synthase
MDRLLKARDDRFIKIKHLLKDNQSVILIKANIPGRQKRIKEAYVLCRVFFNVIHKKFNIIAHYDDDAFDGPYVLVTVDDQDVYSLKQSLIDIEENHPLGRFIDLDLYYQDFIINRSHLGFNSRKCYICDQMAHICAKNQTHQVHELLSVIRSHVRKYIIDDISHQIDLSIMKELDLEDKFGLVTKTSSGSHDDMNYLLMNNAKNAILPFMIRIFKLAYDHPHQKNLLAKARKLGKEAEQAMLFQTSGINAYKGLIFILGFMLIGIGLDLNKKTMNHHIFEDIKKLSKPLIDDFNNKDDTFGLKAYELYGIKGARGEVMQGFPTLQVLMNEFPIDVYEDDVYYRQLLKFIIIHADDTVLLKRSNSMEAYLKYKHDISFLDVSNIEDVKTFTSFCIQHKLSFGGSADLLVTFLLFKYYINHYVLQK